MSLVLVGQAPGRSGAARDGPLAGAADRLAALAGVPREALLRAERVNVLDSWPGRNGKGDLFPPREARLRAAELAGRLRGRVILTGVGVAAAFGVPARPLCEWRRHPAGWDFAVIPHPSGVDRLYNDPAARSAVGAFLRRTLEEEGLTP